MGHAQYRCWVPTGGCAGEASIACDGGAKTEPGVPGSGAQRLTGVRKQSRRYGVVSAERQVPHQVRDGQDFLIYRAKPTGGIYCFDISCQAHWRIPGFEPGSELKCEFSRTCSKRIVLQRCGQRLRRSAARLTIQYGPSCQARG